MASPPIDTSTVIGDVDLVGGHFDERATKKARKLLARTKPDVLAAVIAVSADCKEDAHAQQLIAARSHARASIVAKAKRSATAIQASDMPKVPEWLLAKLRHGFSPPSGLLGQPLQATFRIALRVFEQHDSVGQTQASFDKLSTYFLANNARHVVSTVACSESLQVKQVHATRHLKLIANAIVHFDRDLKYLVLALMHKFVSSQDDLIGLAEIERYDESTLLVARKDVLPITDSSVASRFDRTMGIVAQLHPEAKTSIGQGKMRVPSKLMQRQSDWGVVVQIAPGQFLTVLGSTTNWLQIMDRCTGECYAEADRRTNSRGSLPALQFKEVSKGDCCDQASGIDRGERGLALEWEQYKRVHVSCELHITKIGNNKTFLLMEDFVPQLRCEWTTCTHAKLLLHDVS